MSEIRSVVRGSMVEYDSGEREFIPNSAIPRAPLVMRTGAVVQYCGHDGTFIADLYEVEGAVVVRASAPVHPDTLKRPSRGATHWVRDFPAPAFWRPELGVFVVPKSQIILEEL